MKPHSTASHEPTGEVTLRTARERPGVGHPPVFPGIGPFRSALINPPKRRYPPIPGLRSSTEASSGFFRGVGQIRGLRHA